MDSIQFLYWLQGYFELTVAYHPDGGYKAYPVLSLGRIKCIREHIKIVKEFESTSFESNRPTPTPKTDNNFINWLEGFLDCLEGECIRIHDLNQDKDDEFRVLEMDRYKATRIIVDRLAAQFNKVTANPLVPDSNPHHQLNWDKIMRDKMTCAPFPTITELQDAYDNQKGGVIFPSVGPTFCGGAGD